MDKSKLPRHKIEELRRKEDEQKAKEVYKEFVETFEEPRSKMGKTFVRGEVVNPEAGDRLFPSKSRLYKPAPTVKQEINPFDLARRTAEEKARKLMEEAAAKIRPQKLGKKKDEKPRSNLEAFKEELRRVQEEREERRKLRRQLQEQLGMDSEPLDKIAPSLDNPYLGTYDTDPMTTNLFTSNLNPKSNEEDVCRVFGRFGPLASVKIMWPRTEEERNRGYLTGFVAFMTRRDADRAAAYLKGREVAGHEMKLNWGKPIPIPLHPVYVPPKMLEMTLPPPPSGLPFNAQPRKEDRDAYESKWQVPPPASPIITDPDKRQAWDEMIKNAVVKVVIPTERPLLCLIHRLIEYVVREGPMFEAMIMNKEISNPLYRFLFDNQSPAHVYYRWKLFSILQGDSPTKWRTDEFRMFKNGSIWRPPPVNFYQQGMPVELYDEAEKVEKDGGDSSGSSSSSRHRRDSGDSPQRDNNDTKFVAPLPISSQKRTITISTREKFLKKSPLSDSQRRKLTIMLDNLTPEREEIAEAMIYCVEHADGAEEIVAMVEEGIANPEVSLTRKIAKLYLVADILANCAAKVMNVSYYRKFFLSRLESMFHHLHVAYARIDARLKAEQFKQRVLACCRIWEDTAVYTTDFLIKLQNIFLGLAIGVEQSKSGDFGGEMLDEDIEGVPMDEDEDIDAQAANANKPLVDYDLDGVPLDEEDEHGTNTNGRSTNDFASRNKNSSVTSSQPKETTPAKPAFVASKWETVDPEVVKDQALTLSKWEKLEQEEKAKTANTSSALAAVSGYSYEEDLDGVPMDDETPANVTSHTLSTSSASANYHHGSTKNEMSEEKRLLLREIEVKVMKYQDELESGKHGKSHGSVHEEVERYRQKLLKKVDEKTSSNDQPSQRGIEENRKSSQIDRPSKHNTSSTSHHSTSSKSRDEEKKREKEKESGKKKRRSRSRSRSPSASTSRSGDHRSRHAKKSRSRSRSRSPGRHKKRKH